jgi:hypothetical protein
LATSYDEASRMSARFEDVLVRVKGDNYAFTYRYEPDLYMPKLWCRLHWIIDIQLKKLCDEALLENEETRHSFKYDDYWWTVKDDQKMGAKVFRDTDYTRNMWKPINDDIPKIPIPAEFMEKES